MIYALLDRHWHYHNVSSSNSFLTCLSSECVNRKKRSFNRTDHSLFMMNLVIRNFQHPRTCLRQHCAEKIQYGVGSQTPFKSIGYNKINDRS